MDYTDRVVIALFFSINIPAFVLCFMQKDEAITITGDWLVMLTHLLVIPSIVLMYDTKWYLGVLIYSVITSVLYHLSKIGYYDLERNFSNWDIAVQNILMLSTFFLLVFEDMPTWSYSLIAGVGVFIGAMGEVKIADLEIFEIIGGIVMIFLLVYLIVRTIRPIPIRNNMYIAFAAVAAIVAGITFLVAERNSEDKYSITHAIWHVSAYTMLYFALKSINNDYFRVRQSRDLNDDV